MWGLITDNETWLSFHGIQNELVNWVWVGKNDQARKSLDRFLELRKTFFSILFSSNDKITVNFLPERPTLTATYYVKSILFNMMQSICWKRPTTGIRKVFVNDNVSHHKVKVTLPCSDEQNVHVFTLKSRVRP